DRALPQFQAIDDRLGEANVLRALGGLYVRTGRLQEAEADYYRALRQFQAIDDRLGGANVHLALGRLARAAPCPQEAEAAYDRALPQFQAIDDRLGEANVLQSMGNLALAGGDAPRAFQKYLEAYGRHRETGSALSIAADHVYLARASLAAHQPLRAV